MSELQVANVPSERNDEAAGLVSKRPLRIMQLVDTLDIGGTERVAVNLANQLDQLGHHSFLCTTRRDGPLSSLVAPGVKTLCLHRSRRIELKALRLLRQFVRDHQIELVQAHGTSLVTANFAFRWTSSPKIIWHDHYGTNETKERPLWLFRWLVKRASAIVAVSDPLANWSRTRLGFPPNHVHCISNFVVPSTGAVPSNLELPGRDGSRIICVANLRPVKDHGTLLSAMAMVAQRHPDAHLILVGGLSDGECVNKVREKIREERLGDRVSIMGPRDDVPAILAKSDIGVLSSTSEGLPISLLEYGAFGIPPVVTDVGQCGNVVGDAGHVVPSKSPELLAAKILSLLNDDGQRRQLGLRFRERIRDRFGVDRIMSQWIKIYDGAVNS
jgi:glycosyltransferase involved in cell wall biosynthesis